jgi:hypothetical protein
LLRSGFLPAEHQGTPFSDYEVEPEKMIANLKNKWLDAGEQRRQLDAIQALNQEFSAGFGADEFLEGRIQSRSYDDRDGNKRQSHEVVADRVQLLSKPRGKQDAAPAAEVPKIPNSKCLNCHDDAELTNDAGKSMAVHEDAFKAGAHKRVECVECHVTAGTVRHPRNALGPVSFDVCMDCHEDEITPFKGSVHARVKGGEPKSCEGCHGNIHTTVRSNDPNAPMSPLNQVRNCGACHEEMLEGYLSSVHAKSLFVSGLSDAAWPV